MEYSLEVKPEDVWISYTLNLNESKIISYYTIQLLSIKCKAKLLLKAAKGLFQS